MTAALAVCLVAAFALSGCGGAGLKYTIPDEQVRDIQGPAAARIATARAATASSQSALAVTRQRRDGAKAQLKKTAARKQAAEQRIAAAEQGLESAEATRDKAIAAADARKSAAIAAAEKTWQGESNVAQQRYTKAKGQSNAALSSAERAKAVENARQRYEEALVEERQSLVDLRAAELWLARAKYERVKLEAWLSRQELSPAEAAEKRAAFDKQTATREQAVLDAKSLHLQKSRTSGATKAQLDALLNQG